MYPCLEKHFKLCFLDQAATVLRDLGELGEQLIGLTGKDLNEMAVADFIVIHPTMPDLGLGPSVKDSQSTFYLPLKTFLQGPSNLPQRFFYDELSPAWTQLAITARESLSLGEPIMIARPFAAWDLSLFPALSQREKVGFSWKKNGGKTDQELKLDRAFNKYDKKYSINTLYVHSTAQLKRSCSRIPDSKRDRSSMTNKRYFDEFFATKFLPTELIENTPVKTIQDKINLLDRKYHPETHNHSV